MGQTGDEAWARLIRAHDAAADRVLARYNGRRVKSTGDGLLAVFDDPAQAATSGVELRNEMQLLGLRFEPGFTPGNSNTTEPTQNE